jgi:hypothetical protein
MLVIGSVLTNDYGILPNVNVEVVGEFQYTATDENGKFKINALSPASQLKFSHVGYDYDIVSVAQFQNDSNIMYLFPSTNELNDVIINNNAKSSNTLAWILGTLAVIGIGFAISNKPKKAVNVKV